MRDDDLTTGIEILAEMLLRPAFRQSEIDSERNVVLEEINMNEDDPTDVDLLGRIEDWVFNPRTAKRVCNPL